MEALLAAAEAAAPSQWEPSEADTGWMAHGPDLARALLVAWDRAEAAEALAVRVSVRAEAAAARAIMAAPLGENAYIAAACRAVSKVAWEQIENYITSMEAAAARDDDAPARALAAAARDDAIIRDAIIRRLGGVP